jgi:hypothetical protein
MEALKIPEFQMAGWTWSQKARCHFSKFLLLFTPPEFTQSSSQRSVQQGSAVDFRIWPVKDLRLIHRKPDAAIFTPPEFWQNSVASSRFSKDALKISEFRLAGWTWSSQRGYIHTALNPIFCKQQIKTLKMSPFSSIERKHTRLFQFFGRYYLPLQK